MIAPIPRLRVKKACPTATMIACPVSLEKSKANRKLTPSLNPGVVAAYPTSTTSSTNSSGMRICTAFSSPPFTPRATTTMVSTIKSVWYPNSKPGLASISLKWASDWVAVMPSNTPRAASQA